MSAGVGVYHSEENAESEPLHLYQIWFMPETRGRIPSYRQRDFPVAPNTLQPVVSPREEGALDIGADVSVYRADYDTASTLSVPVAEGRGIFVYVTEGSLSAGGATLSAGDQLRHAEPGTLSLDIAADTKFVLIDVKL